MAESLKKENEALRAQLKKAQEQLEQQAITIKQLQEIIFGKKTEVLEQVADGQLSLFDPVDDLNLDQEITEVVKTTTTKIVRHRPAVNTDLKLSEITGLKMYFFTGLNAVLYVVPCNPSCDMIYQKF